MHTRANDYYMVLRRPQIMEKMEGWQPREPEVCLPKTAHSPGRARIRWLLRLVWALVLQSR